MVDKHKSVIATPVGLVAIPDPDPDPDTAFVSVPDIVFVPVSDTDTDPEFDPVDSLVPSSSDNVNE